MDSYFFGFFSWIRSDIRMYGSSLMNWFLSRSYPPMIATLPTFNDRQTFWKWIIFCCGITLTIPIGIVSIFQLWILFAFFADCFSLIRSCMSGIPFQYRTEKRTLIRRTSPNKTLRTEPMLKKRSPEKFKNMTAEHSYFSIRIFFKDRFVKG